MNFARNVNTAGIADLASIAMSTPGWTCWCGASGLAGPSCAYCGRAAWWLVPPAPAPVPEPVRRAGLDWRGKALGVAIAVLVTVGFGQVGAHAAAKRRAIGVEFDAAVRELAAYVEKAKGAPFPGEVKAKLLGDRAFVEALWSDGVEDEDEDLPADWGATMQALHIAAPDPYDEANETFENGVVGFYDTTDKVLYVRGRSVTPYVRLVIVHELVHAWQDQVHDLDAVNARSGSSDGDAAVHALIEGDAMRVERRWLAEQSAADRAAIEAAQGGGGDGGDLSLTERTLALQYDFPYAVGPEFVDAIARNGGEDAVGRAFDNPPRSTEQVLHPGAYAARHEPVTVAEPAAGAGRVVDSGVLGEFGLFLLLAGGDLDDRSIETALVAASGWGGDAYVTWENATGYCTQADVRMDSRAARDRLVAELRASYATGSTVTPTGRDGASLRYCVG